MKKNDIIIALIYGSLFFALGAFFPFNTLYLTNELGFDGQQLGLFYSISSLIVAVSVPVIGMIADKIKSPKKMYMLCALLTASFFVPYLVFVNFYLVTITYIFIHSIRSSLIPLSDSVAIDYCYKHNSDYGILRSIGSLCFIISSVVVGFILKAIPSMPSLFIYIHMIMLVISMLCMSKAPNDYSISESSNTFKNDVIDLIKNKQYIVIILIMGISYAIIQVSQAYFPLSIEQLGGGNDIVGISMFFMTIPEVILFSYMLKLTDKIPHIYLMLIGAFLLFLRWVLSYFVVSIPFLLFSSTTHGLTMAFVVIIGMNLIKLKVPAHLLSTAIAIYTGIANIIYSLISFIAGAILDAGGLSATYVLYSVVMIIALVLAFLYINIYQRKVTNK